MRLRPLSEAECYARCYGGHPGDSVSVVHELEDQGRVPTSGERLAELFSVRVDSELYSVRVDSELYAKDEAA